MKVYFSSHATIKHAQEFPHIDICEELKTAVLMGGQVGVSKAYLCKSNVVVIMETNTIITILTYEHYVANMQMRNPAIDTLSILNSQPIPKLSKAELKLLKQQDKRKQDEEDNEEKESLRVELIEVIKKHIQKDF